MSVVPASQISAISTGFADIFARGIKSFIPPAEKQTESWVEIYPYGFVSRNYINYMKGRRHDCTISTLPDGDRLVSFADGAILVHSEAGHMVELDRNRRVVMVRVRKSEAEGARLALGGEISECFRSSTNDYGQNVVIMPGNIVIVESRQQIKITFPNGTEFFAAKPAA
jgi:hypothetical protein